MRIFVASLLLFTLTACVNNFEKFYVDGGRPVSDTGILPPSGNVKILTVSIEKQSEAVMKMLENGYIYLGHSNFNDRLGTHDQIRSVAKKIGAEQVVFASQLTDRETRNYAMETPTTETTYHSGRVGDYFNNNSSIYYSGSTTTYGTKTTYVPYTVENYEQKATFFAKRRPGGLAIYARDLKNEERKKINSNMGAFVTVVVKGGSAFKANLLPDDIILGVYETEVEDSAHLFKLISKEIGKQQVPITFWRDGGVYTLHIDIDEYDMSDLKPMS